MTRKTTTLHVHHAFLYISFPSLHDYDVKFPNFTFCGGREHKTTTFFFFLRTSIQSFRVQPLENLSIFDELNEIKISAIKFKATRILFLSDVSVAVAVVVALSSPVGSIVSLRKDILKRCTSTGSSVFAFWLVASPKF